jgi:hypothetical protein
MLLTSVAPECMDPWIGSQATPVSCVLDHKDPSNAVVPASYSSYEVEFLQLISVNRKNAVMPSQSSCSFPSRKSVPQFRSRVRLVAFGRGRKGSLQREVIEIPTKVPDFLL